jgi:peptidoglycan/xylan/chitin deacetylase (PgdA/CDA1 family)
MLTKLSAKVRPKITFSWDDGHPLDMRIGQLMADCGLRATFYIPISIDRPLLDTHQLLDLCAMGMEIGSHGLTHSLLTRSHNVRGEMAESRDKLEQMLIRPVTSFCYPFGKFNHRTALIARETGYRLARTTQSFSINRSLHPFRMPVTLQFAPHSRVIHLRHAVRGLNAHGIVVWGARWHFEGDLRRLSRRAFRDACRLNGTFHVWGHSWEIDELGLWSMLADFCQHIGGRADVSYVTNSCVPSEMPD